MAFFRYTVLRLLLLLAVGAILYVLGLRGFWWLFAAFFVSGVVSLFVLRRSRDEASASLVHRMETSRQRRREAVAEAHPAESEAGDAEPGSDDSDLGAAEANGDPENSGPGPAAPGPKS